MDVGFWVSVRRSESIKRTEMEIGMYFSPVTELRVG